MVDIFEIIQKRVDFDDSVNVILLDIESSKTQVNNKMDKIKKNLDYRELYQVIILVESFWDENEITLYALCKLFEYYLEYVNFLIQNDHYSLYALLDLFGKYCVVFENSIADNEMFIEKTYSLLLTKKMYGEASDIAIALDKFFDLITICEFFPNGKEVLEKFIRENPTSPYLREAIEKLGEIG